MQPIPTEFPKDEVAYLLPLLRGQVPSDKRLAVHCALVVIDYGSGFVVPGVSATITTGEGGVIASWLDSASKIKDVPQANIAIAIPWGQVIAFLLPLILKWLREHQE